MSDRIQHERARITRFGRRARIRGTNVRPPNAPLPPGFTGRDGGTYYYLGRPWNGPSNMIGAKA